MRPWYKQIDWLLILAWVGLVTLGLVAIFSTTTGQGAEYLLDSVKQNFSRQSRFFVLAVVVMGLCLTRPARFYHSIAWPAYALGLGLMLVTAAIGREVNGAKAWLYIGSFGFQTAEPVKVATLLAVAAVLAGRNARESGLKRAIVAVVLLLIPAAIVIGPQRDTGTGLVFLGLIPIMLFWSGLPLWIMAMMLAPAIVGYFSIVYMPAAIALSVLFTLGVWITSRNRKMVVAALLLTGGVSMASSVAVGALQPHQVARIKSFTNPEAEEYKDNVGYHLVQSKAAIGAGGLTGKGFRQGTQTQGAYIPEQSTDFVFSIIGEEFGFLGSLTVLGLYGLLLGRLIKVGTQMRSPFGSMMAAGAAGIFLIHLFVNLGMVTGLLPVIGIPLPFISYGGAALMANTLLLGVVVTLHMRRDDFSIYGG